MPTYDYECSEGHRFELFQKMTEEPVASCPECGAAAERKISGGAGFLFKGDGFYITDYRSAEYKKKASAEGPDGGSGASKGSAGDGSSGAAASGSADSAGSDKAGAKPKPSGGAAKSDGGSSASSSSDG